MGLRNSKPKHSKGKKIEKSVRNKDGQQMNEFTEQTFKIRQSAKKTGKKNSDVGFQTKKSKTKIKCKIKGTAQETDEFDTDNEDLSNQYYIRCSISKAADEYCTTYKRFNFGEKSSPPYRCRSSDNYEAQISRMDKITAQGIPYVPRRRPPAPPPPDVLD